MVDVQLQRDLLQVHDDVGSVLRNIRDRSELMEDSLDLHGGDSRAFDRREQNATKGVADSGAKASLKRLSIKVTVRRR